LSQPFYVAEQFTWNPWVYAKLDDTVIWFRKIIDWEVDHIPENYFMYKAGIAEVISAYEKAGKGE
jgi:F-type H+-transporting ATPase subunit beta